MAARSDRQLTSEVETDESAASGLGFEATPSFVFVGDGVQRRFYPANAEPTSFVAAIKHLLAHHE